MQNSQRETAEVKDCIEKAVTLTKDMLMLLPPFVVTVNPKINNERLHDINRSTWDTKGSSKELIYYRPILVYGNQLHVAVKGLVGNVEKGLSTHHTRQLHKQGSALIVLIIVFNICCRITPIRWARASTYTSKRG